MYNCICMCIYIYVYIYILLLFRSWPEVWMGQSWKMSLRNPMQTRKALGSSHSGRSYIVDTLGYLPASKFHVQPFHLSKSCLVENPNITQTIFQECSPPTGKNGIVHVCWRKGLQPLGKAPVRNAPEGKGKKLKSKGLQRKRTEGNWSRCPKVGILADLQIGFDQCQGTLIDGQHPFALLEDSCSLRRYSPPLLEPKFKDRGARGLQPPIFRISVGIARNFCQAWVWKSHAQECWCFIIVDRQSPNEITPTKIGG